MWEEFKEFALKGNALSLAIGVIIGAAFGKIVDALVNDIIMPILGIAGKADFTNYYVPLSSAVTATNLTDARKQGGVLAYGGGEGGGGEGGGGEELDDKGSARGGDSDDTRFERGEATNLADARKEGGFWPTGLHHVVINFLLSRSRCSPPSRRSTS